MSSRHHRRYLAIVCVLLGIALVVGLWTATHWLAWRFGYAPSLGAGVARVDRGLFLLMAGALVIAACALGFYVHRARRYVSILVLAGVLLYAFTHGPVIYAPWEGLMWAVKVILAEGVGGPNGWMVREAYIAALVGGAFSFLCMAPLLFSPGKRTSGAYGTASFEPPTTLSQRTNGRHVDRGGPVIGRREDGSLIHYGGEGHLLTLARTGAGKDVSCITPNLLSYPGSVVVEDPKVESYPITARYREEVLGQRILVLDPFRRADTADGHLARYNPLDLIHDDSDRAIDDARMIARMLVHEASKYEVPHWKNEARNFITGVILYVTGTEERGSVLRSLPYVRNLLLLPTDYQPSWAMDEAVEWGARYGMRDVINDEIEGVGEDGRPRTFDALLQDMMLRRDLYGGVVSRAAIQLNQKDAEKERKGVISTAHESTNFLDSARMQESLSASTFDPMVLKEENVTLYVILPVDLLETYSRWLRLITGCILTRLQRDLQPYPYSPKGMWERFKRFADRTTQEAGKRRVLVLMNEFANMGNMPPIVQGISLMRGYGVTLWLFLQDLPQLKGEYPQKWETFLANTDVLQAFGNRDPATTEYLSKMLGRQTVFVETQNISRGHGGGRHSRNWSEGTREVGRSLMYPDEIRMLPEDRQILIVGNKAPVIAKKVRYYDEEPFRSRAAPSDLRLGHT